MVGVSLLLELLLCVGFEVWVWLGLRCVVGGIWVVVGVCYLFGWGVVCVKCCV